MGLADKRKLNELFGEGDYKINSAGKKRPQDDDAPKAKVKTEGSPEMEDGEMGDESREAEIDLTDEDIVYEAGGEGESSDDETTAEWMIGIETDEESDEVKDAEKKQSEKKKRDFGEIFKDMLRKAWEEAGRKGVEDMLYTMAIASEGLVINFEAGAFEGVEEVSEANVYRLSKFVKDAREQFEKAN